MALKQYTLRLPHMAACIELDDVRAAHRLCSNAALHGVSASRDAFADDVASPETGLVCARSTERLCVQRAASIPPRCRVRSVLEAVSWRAVVFGIALHDSVEESRLLQAAADTWLRMARGADLVLVTDFDDVRNASAIAPRLDGGVHVHVYRCAECRGQPCPTHARGRTATSRCRGVREGWLARRKVLHLFAAMAELFGVGAADTRASGGGDDGSDTARHVRGVVQASAAMAQKQFFLKVDPDTVPVPHNILRLLDEMQFLLSNKQSYLFGMAACRVASFPLCHAAGGAGYGLSRSALVQLMRFLEVQYPHFLERVDKFTYGGEDVAVAFALKKQTGAAVLNVGCLYQHAPLKYRKLHSLGEDWVRWPLSSTPASFHQIKDADQMRAFFACALYDEHGQPRASPRELFTALQHGNGVAARQSQVNADESAMKPCHLSMWAPLRHKKAVPRDGWLHDGGVISLGSARASLS